MLLILKVFYIFFETHTIPFLLIFLDRPLFHKVKKNGMLPAVDRRMGFMPQKVEDYRI